MKNYYTTLAYLERFIIARFTKKDFPLDKLDYAFIEQFEYFIRNTPIKSHDRCEGNGVYKHMERLCKVVGLGRRLKRMNTNPFMDYRKHPTKPQRKALDIKELGKIESQEFTDSQIAYIQDLFLFSCYTGLAYADITTLKTSNLYRSNDGKLLLDKYREKSSELSLVPLLTDAINILNRYWNGNSMPERIISPYVSNQEVNRNLKILRATCGISKEITFHIARHTFATTVTLKNGVPIETVSKMLGHTKLSTTQIYAKVDEEKIAENMALVQDRLDKSRKGIGAKDKEGVSKQEKRNYEDTPDEELLKKGQMEKSPFDMHGEELKAWKINSDKEIRKYLFSIKQPLVYYKDGRIVAEYEDGTIKEVD